MNNVIRQYCDWYNEFKDIYILIEGIGIVKVYSFNDKPTEFYISNLYVNESERRNGYGTELLKEAIKEAIYKGATNISLWVKKYQSKEIEWYKSHGFEYLKDYPKEDAIWLTKNLQGVKGD